MTPFESFQIYLAIKQHFTSTNYDCFKYNFKVKTQAANFDSRKDKYHFTKLAKQSDVLEYCVSNMLASNGQRWIGDFEPGCHVTRQMFLQSLTYKFQDQLKTIGNIDDAVKVINGQYPQLLYMYLQDKVRPETIIILNDIADFFPYWDKRLANNPLWEEQKKTFEKYRPFVRYDKNKFKDLVVKYLNESYDK